MRVLSLSVQNIGPFDNASLEFLASPEDRPAVTLITGENGTGKTILLDSIRALFGRPYAKLERTLDRPRRPYLIEMRYALSGGTYHRKLEPYPDGTDSVYSDDRGGVDLTSYPGQARAGRAPDWVVDYWRSAMALDSYEIKALAKPDLWGYLEGALQGMQPNAQVTQLLCYFDYLRDSRNARERQAGEALYGAAERIIRASLLNGEFIGVQRTSLTPMVRQAGQEVPLANVSSGNAYLIQRMITLLGKMYAVHVLNNTPVEQLCQTSGLLLIDEAENHFHPRWQKRFLQDVLSVFSNLQIIATTHSPFILASVPGARVYVCRWDGRTCTVSEETDAYANQPVDEILLSGAFDHTQPFSTEITDLLQRRRQAIQSGDEQARRQIEAQLIEKNPEHFSYLQVQEKLRATEAGC